MPGNTCAKCGGEVKGLVCAYCGAPSPAVCDPSSEKKALEEYHGLLDAADGAKREQLLLDGFLPTDLPVLIDAGLRVMPMISIDGPSHATAANARNRLDAIIAKLKILPPSDESARALKVFSERIAAYESADKRQIVFGLILIAGLAAAGLLAWKFLFAK